MIRPSLVTTSDFVRRPAPSCPSGESIRRRTPPRVADGAQTRQIPQRGRAEEAAVLARELAALSARLPADGVIWVSWPKKSAGVATDIGEDTVRALALPIGLVDIKVCAIDATWSGLKLMWRRELRAGKPSRG